MSPFSIHYIYDSGFPRSALSLRLNHICLSVSQTMNGQTFCLKWDHFRTSVTSVFNNLRQEDELVDITLCCEGQRLKAHRMMLSACSPYFRELLKVGYSSGARSRARW